MSNFKVPKVKDFVTEQDLDLFHDNLYLEIGDVRKIKVDNPLMKANWYNSDRIPEEFVRMCRDPLYLHFAAKYICNCDLLPYQGAVLDMLWNKTLCMLVGSRGMAKSYLLALYIVLRLVFHQGSRIVVVGAGLRQALVVWNYVNKIWMNSPVLQDIVGVKNYPKRDLHMAYWDVGQSRCMFLPLGTGDKIRGERATHVIGEEFASIPEDIFETVVRGFAAVRSDGVVGNVKEAYKNELARQQGSVMTAKEIQAQVSLTPTILPGNQIIMSGTAYYQFNHFYKYYQYYRAVIMTGGDKQKLKEMFPDKDIGQIDSKNYGIIRIPADILPLGLMDKNILQQGKATMDPSIFKMEYMACFPADSEGFFLASMINKCTCPLTRDGKKITFSAETNGSSGDYYAMGIDPASENDRFTVNLQKLGENFGCVTYQWSTNRKEFEKLKKDGLLIDDINDYQTFCIKHIRSLVRRFNVRIICLDSGGGGLAIREGLRDPAKCDPGDKLIIEHDATSSESGERILHLIQFADSEWRKAAHWGLRKDLFEQKVLFPYYDAATIEVQSMKDSSNGVVYDTLEEIYGEIEQCKTETTFIQHQQTVTGQEKWDVPQIRGGENKHKLQRDRFTSLLLSNWGRRIIEDLNKKPTDPIECYGGVARGGGAKRIEASYNQMPMQGYGDGSRQIFW